jgi:hypothetical protein
MKKYFMQNWEGRRVAVPNQKSGQTLLETQTQPKTCVAINERILPQEEARAILSTLRQRLFLLPLS